MRRLLLVLALLALACPAGRAETGADELLDRAGISRLEALSQELNGPDVRAVADAALSGKLEIGEDLPAEIMRRLRVAVRSALLEALTALAAPVAAALALRLVLGGEAGPLTLLCRLACAYSLSRHCAAAMEAARSALGTASRIAGVAAPVVAGAMTLTGRGASAAALTPLSAICVDAIDGALIAWGLPLCGVAAIVAAGGCLSDRFRLDRLFALICGAVTWGVGLMITAFVAVMALEGRLAAARDGASAQAVRQALRGLIPYIGGSLSDSSGALLETAATVRNAVGVTGLMIALGAAVEPALRLGAHMLSLKLASALVEPVADPGIVRVTACFGEVARLLLALYAAGAMLTALLAGAGLGLAGF